MPKIRGTGDATRIAVAPDIVRELVEDLREAVLATARHDKRAPARQKKLFASLHALPTISKNGTQRPFGALLG